MGVNLSKQTYLLVDVGNSRMKWNIWEYGTRQFAQETQGVTYKEQTIVSLLNQQWESVEESINQVIVSNVAGNAIADEIKKWCIEHWEVDPQFVETSASFRSVQNGYRNYSELGVDRWLAVIAAQALYPDQEVIVIDCGTAITVDAVTRDGQHHAGPIIPGRQMMFQALASSTADLDNVPENNQPVSVTVDNTQKAITSGVNFAISSALDTVVAKMRQYLIDENGANKVVVIVTGGAAEALMSLTQMKDFTVEPDLVLTGLREMAIEKQ